MTRRITQVVLLCEDQQHESFVRRFLELRGIRLIRVVKAPRGRGSGEKWVHDNYVKEVRAHRSASHVQGRALLVLIDEDTSSTKRRESSLAAALATAGQDARDDAERIVHVIPERNIETWLTYLEGQNVDASSEYPKLSLARDCGKHVAALKVMCDRKQLRHPAPPSLERACKEVEHRLT